MHPLRHSASFPSLPWTGGSLPLPPSPFPAPPSQPSSPSGQSARLPPVAAAPRPSLTSQASPVPSPRASAAAASSPLYVLPAVPLCPPPLFSRVEASLYRCAFFSASSAAFVASLRLRAALVVGGEALPAAVAQCLHAARVHVHALHAPEPTPSLLKAALEYALHAEHQPLLLLSSPGALHKVALLVGCLRRLQGWCYAAVMDEYEREVRAAGGGDALDDGRRWADHALMEAEWVEDVWVDEARRVRWWREAQERARRKRRYRDRALRAATSEAHRTARAQRSAQRQRQRQLCAARRLSRSSPSPAPRSDDEAREAEYEARVQQRLTVESEEDAREAREEADLSRLDAAHADEDASLDRLLFANPTWRVISNAVTFDKRASIIEDDDD